MSSVVVAQSSSESSSAALFFGVQAAILVIGFLIHVYVDRHEDKRTKPRVIELALLWTIVGTGVWAIIGGLNHIGPNSDEVAKDIGFLQSMFQWEVGWADIGLGVLGVGCIWKRDGWLDAAVVMMSISYLGDGVGHIMEWVAHDNTAPNNVYAIPTDFLQPLLAIVLLVAYRRTRTRVHEPAAT